MIVLNASHYLLCARYYVYVFSNPPVSSAYFATNAEVGYGISARYQCYKAVQLIFRAMCVQWHYPYIYGVILPLNIAIHLPDVPGGTDCPGLTGTMSSLSAWS